jgi:signal transduction histidine kinase/ActR/RegA family two-component response regulator
MNRGSRAKPSRARAAKPFRRAVRAAEDRRGSAQPPRVPREIALSPSPPVGTVELDDLANLLRHRRQALGHTVRSSKEYWTAVHRILELRAALAAAEGRVRELYDFIPVAFLVLDGAFGIRAANAAAVALCGPQRVAVGQPLRAVLEFESFERLSAVLAAGGPPQPVEVTLRAERGSITAQVTAQSVDQSVLGAGTARTSRVHYLAISDVSEVRRLEDERVALEKEQRRSQEAERAAREAERSKDEFIAMLSHELRTPLTPVLAAVGAIGGEPLPGSVREAIAVVRRNVNAEARLIDDLLDVTRIRQGRLSIDRRPVALHDLLTQVLVDWQPEAARRGLTVELARDACSDVVLADRDRIAQVLRNVLGNATKFTDPGGLVAVRTSDSGDRIRVTVTDTGAGMDERQQEHLFQAFAGTRQPVPGRSGLGLGLVISRGIVEAHGGRIRVTSAGPGQGTTVEVELGLADESVMAEALAPAPVRGGLPPAPPAPVIPRDIRQPGPEGSAIPAGDRSGRGSPSPRSGDGGKPRVLLVEDHEDSAATLSMVLSIRGYPVRVARTVAEARGMTAECDVLVSDISLPDGSGIDVLREARQHRDVKAIAVSGYGTEDDVRRSTEAGFAEHLVKPFDPERLIVMLDELGGDGRADVTERPSRAPSAPEPGPRGEVGRPADRSTSSEG